MLTATIINRAVNIYPWLTFYRIIHSNNNNSLSQIETNHAEILTRNTNFNQIDGIVSYIQYHAPTRPFNCFPFMWHQLFYSTSFKWHYKIPNYVILPVAHISALIKHVCQHKLNVLEDKLARNLCLTNQ